MHMAPLQEFFHLFPGSYTDQEFNSMQTICFQRPFHILSVSYTHQKHFPIHITIFQLLYNTFPGLYTCQEHILNIQGSFSTAFLHISRVLC